MADSVQNESGLRVGSHKLIYVFEIERSEQHEGRVKVGEATIKLPLGFTDFENVPKDAMLQAAKKRIDTYTKTSDTEYKILHVEMAVREAIDRESKTPTGNYEGFQDYAIHRVLKNSGFAKDNRRKDKKNGEWFSTTAEAAIAAIKAYKSHKNFIETEHFPEIELYPEQELALNKTLATFKDATIGKPKKMLWNAKMRFGKTLTAYATIDKLSAKGISKVLILTHFPSVRDGWYEDYRKSPIRTDWTFGDKTMSVDFNETSTNDKFVWFASIQDIRGSYNSDDISDVDFENLKKNSELFSTEWDLIITDEAHLGTLTELAKKMYIDLKSARYLDLSGTPFNILKTELMADEEKVKRFTHDGTFSWSYVDEQEAKERWYIEQPEEPNPYANRPEVKFVTYDVSDAISQIPLNQNTTASYSLTELFKVRSDDATLFAHERLVRDLLNKLRGEERYVDRNMHLFPFSDGYGVDFDHTFWLLPNVSAVNAMQKLLEKQSSGFSGYKIINATGEGMQAEDVKEDSALKAVKTAIKNNKKTITLSQQMLSTGVTIPEWNAVLMMNNTKSLMSYMQASFRAASSGSLPDGRVKETSYVLDFNPERCLEVIVETATINATERLAEATTQKEEREIVESFVKRMPILSFNGATFEERDSRAIMEEINRVFIEETVSNGFDTKRIFNDATLLKFDLNKARIINMLNGNKGKDKVKITEVTEADRKKLKELNEKNKDDEPLTAVEKKEKQELESKVTAEKKNRETAEKILVSVITRSPMLVFAANAHEGEIELETFNQRVDDKSWDEFMDKRIKRVMPEEIKKISKLEERFDLVEDGKQPDIYWEDIYQFYNKTIFEGACRRIREMTDEANAETDPILHALYKIQIFGTFRNPDKETVLTPSRVVQLQMSNTIGGIELFDMDASTSTDFFVWVEDSKGKRDSIHINDAVAGIKAGDYKLAYDFKKTKDFDWEAREFTMYDPNSKSALYPLFATMSRFTALKESESVLTDADLWDRIIDREIYLNTRVKYSALIAKRMLTRNGREVNATTIDIIKLLKAFKEYNSLKKNEQPEGYKKIDNIYEGVSVLLRFAQKNFMKLHNVIATYAIDDKTFEDVEEIIGKIDSGNYNLEDMMKFQKLIEAFKNELPKFDVVVSNPPYQLEVNNINSDIWDNFIEVSSLLSKFGSFIHPGRWVVPKKTMITIQDMMVEKGLKSFSYLTTPIFSDVAIGGNITITFFNFSKKSTNIKFNVDFSGEKDWSQNKKIFFNEYEEELYLSIQHLLESSTMENLIVGVPMSLGSDDFGYQKGTMIDLLKKSSEGMNEPIKIWANPNLGRGHRFEWLFIEKSALNESSDLIKARLTRKIMIDKKGNPSSLAKKGNVFNNRAEIIARESIASGKFMLMPIKDTDRDLELISSLMETKTARALMSITQKDLYVRGLDNIPIYTELAKQLSEDELFTDKWFYDTFDFSKELIEYIEKSISPK